MPFFGLWMLLVFATHPYEPAWVDLLGVTTIFLYVSYQVWRGAVLGRVTVNGLSDADRTSSPILFRVQFVLHVVMSAAMGGALLFLGVAWLIERFR